MCRANSQGGRRCKGCQATAARDAHNFRRRLNRAIKAEALERAQAAGLPSTKIAILKQLPPGHAKQWALENGLAPGNTGGDIAPKPQAAAAAAAQAPEPVPSGPAAGAPPEVREQAAALMALQGTHPDEGQLLSKEVSEIGFIGGGVNTTNRVVFTDGTVGFHKPFSGLNDSCASAYGQQDPLQPIHEAAAWHLANCLGARFRKLVPPCVLREVDGEIGSLAKGVTGMQGSPSKPRRAIAEDAAFFDALIGQQDRHRYNFFTEGDNIHLIDHGFTFATTGDAINRSHFLEERTRRNATRLKAFETAALKKLLASPNLHGLADVLTPERAQALKQRAEDMLSTGRLPAVGRY
ncbi:hypothetical protein [Paenarthrobacter nicotinovorans]|uniref:hypothetical protein n=1 Tax=Paenarthrobacter nicotinovorans TaxID=29320 RepID=UPI0011A2FB0D|nr:hypothetical protein [Paenarthrobacter nicotinovorans]